MEIVISIVAKIAEYTVAPVGRWLCYSCHYNSNMENLKNREKNLWDAKNKVQRLIDSASRKGEVIEDDVQTWLTKVDGILHQLATKKLGGGEAEASTRSSNAACLNLKHRHQLSREAKKIVENIAELLKNGNFNSISYRLAPQEMAIPRNMDYMTLDSRISIMKRIMEALGDANVNKIGVWGAPGVGKSTLMKEIFKKAKEESLFHEVALANVTNNPDPSRIQGEIAEMLDLDLDPDKIVTIRAGRLRARLEKDNEKKILVILDDIWEQLDLEEIGITPSERCKVLLTSRERQVLASEMDTEENSFKLDILGEQEAWKLFEKMAGDSIKYDHDLQNEAIKVAKACEGLPIALVTVSRALKNYKNLRIWKDALVQLTRPTPKHDTKIWSPVYSCIELSYEHLVDREVKSLFLLCARQGYHISYQDLLRYGFGLRLFYGIDTLEEARNRLETLVNNLQDSCLLLQSPHSSEEFYMHDVIRHVATIIASNDHNMFVMRGDGGQNSWPDVDALKICEALSIHGGDHIHKYPNKIECPKLRYFHVQCINRYLATPSGTSFQGMGKLEDIFFQGMDKLEVLSLTNIQLSSLLSLGNLQTLCLDGCKLGDIHGIGELKNLVILSLARSDISNLPREIGLLTRLRLLDLSSCYELRVIPPNVLSSLVNLEELYMRKIAVQWEVEGPSNGGKNASLAELEKLSHLITLEIDIPDANNRPANLFHEKLERYKICIGGTWHLFFKEEFAFSRMLKLKLNMSFQLDFGIKMLLKRTEYLHLDESNITKSVLYQLDREDFQQLKHLCIENNGNIKHIPELRTSAFKNLKVLKVENCETLRFIFSSSIARGLSLLEELNITRCNNMGAMFVKEEEDEIEDQGDMMLFGRLQTLVLKDLPKLVGFLSTRETNSEGNLHDFQLPLLHHQVSLPSLQTLSMVGLPKIKQVWSCGQEPKTVFSQLKILEISNCGVEEIVAVAVEGGGEAIAIRTFEFPQVSTLKFKDLKKLKWFYKGVHVSKWPMLKAMQIERCKKVKIFASEVVSFQETVEEQRPSEMSNIKQPLFSVDELSFSSLETLLISNMDSLEIIFGKLEGQNGREPQVLISPASGTEESVATTHFVSTGKLPLIYFKNLKVLEVENCQKLRYFSSSSIARGLSLLEKLKIKRCNNMGAIGMTEGKDGIEDGDVILFHQLQTLVLENLPELVSFLSTESSFMTDCGQIIAEGNHNLHMPLLHQQVSLPSLQTLRMVGLPKIKQVWSCGQEPKTVFSQLKILEISNCGVEEIVAVAVEGGGEAIAIRTFEFPQVSTLKFKDLKRLKWFYKGVHVSKWPLLKEMKIKRCEKVEIFASRVVSFEKIVEDQRQSAMSNIKQSLFLVDELSFSSLETLLISNMDSLEIIFGKLEGQNGREPQVLISPASGTEESVATTHFVSTGKLPLIYFKNLKVLEVENCQKLRYFSSSSIARGLSLLEKLKIKRCNNMGAIVMTEGKDGIEDGDVILFHQLQTLVLENLPELVSFLSTESSFMTDCGQIIAEGNHNLHMPLLHQQVSLPSLQTLRMVGLPKIKQVWSCGQEPKTVFSQLKILEISNCGVEEIVAVAVEGGGEAIAIRTFEFPQVTALNFINLKKLKWFYKGVHVSKWPMLKEMQIERCKKVKIFASEVVSFQETVEEQRPSEMSNIKQPLFSVDELSFPSLKTLHIGQMDKLEIIGQDQVAASVFSNIQELTISYCAKLLHVFPTSILMKSLTTLQKLTIVSCGVEEIVAVEGRGGEAAARTLVFPRVTDLTLQRLWRLKWFHKGVHVSKWPMLEKMSIGGCEKVEIFASGVVSFEEILEEMQSEMSIKQPLFLVDELSFPSLKTLHIRWMYKLEIIWQDQVAATSFSNIQELTIWECAKLLHVFQSNLHTTTTLIQSLTTLRIEYCDSLETIFRNMEGQNGKESQVLIAPSSGLEESIAREDGTTRHIEFPTLTEISLVGLPKLKWIFEGVHTNLECPSLKILQPRAFGQVINMNWASKFPRSSSSQENQLQTCIQQPIFVFDEATFPNLEMLSLDYCGKTNCPSRFPNLEMFSLDYGGKTKCPSRFSDFPAGPSCPIIRLPTLLELKVCSSGWEEISSCGLVDREIRLRKLSLNHLPMLIHLWKEDNTQPCPLFHNLEFLGLSRCSKLKNLVPSSVSLHNLIDLNISSCHGLTNLLTSSTAKTLVRIKSMTVTNCKRITEIVAMEDGEANVAITFNNLTFLELNGLPNLTNFCSGPYFFGFPYLREVTVRCCPEMKTFSHGVLSTPKLTAVYDDYRWVLKRNLHWEDDLNTTTRRLWESNQYDTQWLFKERVENSEEDENHPSEDENHSENSEEDEDHTSEDEDEDHSENSEEG